MVSPSLWIALLAAMGGCFFSACNIALKTYSRSRLAELLGERQADRLESFNNQSAQLQLMTATIRTLLSLVVLLAMLDYIQGQLHVSRLWQYLIALISAGLLVSVLVVAIPLSWARYGAEPLLAWAMMPLRVCLAVCSPLVRALHVFDPIIRRISGADIQPRDADEAITDEVMSVVEDHESGGKVDPVQKQMIEAVFEFPSITAGEIMTPRTEMHGIEIDSTLAQIKEQILAQGHSRYPVYEDNLDHITGILYVKDLVQFLDEPDSKKLDLRRVMREPTMVPESKPIRDLLAQFRVGQGHIAILLDEYGGTAGMITIEDIIEEIVGEIQDEHEPVEEKPDIVHVDENTIEVEARMNVHDLNDQLSLNLPEADDYDTVGGFLFASLGHIPEIGETYDQENLRLTVIDAERTRITRVRIQRLESTPSPGPTSENRGNGNAA